MISFSAVWTSHCSERQLGGAASRRKSWLVIMANTKRNDPRFFVKNNFVKEAHPKCDPGCTLGARSASDQQNECRFEYNQDYKSHVLATCISGLPLYELSTTANAAVPTVAVDILAAADRTLSERVLISGG